MREDTDQTQAAIAALLKVVQRTYCDYELGKARIPVDSLILLARLYNVSMDYITGGSDVGLRNELHICRVPCVPGFFRFAPNCSIMIKEPPLGWLMKKV